VSGNSRLHLREKSTCLRVILGAVGQQLRTEWSVTKPAPEHLADLVRQVDGPAAAASGQDSVKSSATRGASRKTKS
jgi:hypothetical protein